MGAAAICPQYEAFAHELHLRPIIEKPATLVGTLVHVGTAYRYGMLLAERPSWLVYPGPREAIWILGQDRTDASLEALRIFDAYEVFYKENYWRPLLVEHQFIVEMEGEPYTARIDLLAQDMRTNEICLIDHKTVWKMTKNIGNDYRSDRQMLTGLALARAHGWDVRRVIINALSKEHPEPLFKRFDVPISEIAYERLGEDTRFYLRLMKYLRQTYPDPMNRPRNWDCCVRKYGRCDFYPICTDGATRLDEYKTKG